MSDLPSSRFPPSREAALERLNIFLPEAGGAYARTRNADKGSMRLNGVSGLSPYLRRRVVTERDVCARVLDRYPFAEAEKFLQEVCWRTYWKGWLELRPGIWTAYVDSLRHLQSQHRAGAPWSQRFAGAMDAQTGISCFDHWVLELRENGYLHNHARMWFAGIWIYTLGLPWALGADFFARHLLDGDPASNTLSWRWVAGLHTRGKQYKPRASNIRRYTGGRFDDLSDLPWISAGPEFRELPKPRMPEVRDRSLPEAFTLLLCAEDWAMDLPHELVRGAERVVLLTLDTWPETWMPSETVLSFERAVREDVARHWGEHAPVEIKTFAHFQREMAGKEPSTLVMPYLPAGPRRDVLEEIWKDVGFTPKMWTREWDHKAWPHAKAGFFGFWKKFRSSVRDQAQRP